MSIERTCCGLDLKKTGFWRSIGSTIGCLALAGSIWVASSALLSSKLQCSAQAIAEFIYFILDVFHSFDIETKETIFRILCVINLMACLSWLFGIIAIKVNFAKITLIWWTILSFLYFYYLLLHFNDVTNQQWDQPSEFMALLLEIFINSISAVVSACFYATALVCYISLKEVIRRDLRNAHWLPVLQTVSAEIDEKFYDDHVEFGIL